MARAIRIDYPGAFHHVLCRTNNRKHLLKNSCDKRNLIKHFLKTIELYNFKIHAYCILDNHFHIIIESGKTLISKVMQYIIGNFTMEYNKIHNRVGHLFQGRFKNYLIDKDNYFICLVRYILNNPVRAGIVKHAEEYKWSSYNSYFNEHKQDFITKNLVEHYYNNIIDFKNYIDSKNISFNPKPHLIHNTKILGKKVFEKQVIQKFKEKIQINEPKVNKITHDEIIKLVSNKYHQSIENLLKKGMHSNSRRILAYLLRYYANLNLLQISTIINYSPPRVSEMINEAKSFNLKELKIIEAQIQNSFGVRPSNFEL